MGFTSGKKKKNDEPRRSQAWLLVVGVVVALVLIIFVVQSQSQSTGDGTQDVDESILMTATYIVEQATGTALALGTPPANQNEAVAPGEVDSIQMTATYIIQQATQQAASP